MILLEDQVTLTDLHTLINQVPRYPVTVRRLIDLARYLHSPRPVIDFYQTFPDDEVFIDKDDLLATSENVEMLRHQTAPPEEMNAPEED